MSNSLPILFAVYPILFSGITLVWLFNIRHRRWSKWAIQVLACAAIFVFIFMTGPWGFTSYYLRYVFLGLFALTAALSYFRVWAGDTQCPTHDARVSVPAILVFFLFAVLDALAIGSYHSAGKSLDVAFPLRSGTYYVLQGGSSIVTNPFHALGINKLAIDIVKLNSLGNRADGIAPQALSAYQSFGEKVYSPCRGSVLMVHDSMSDHPPGHPDTEHPEGNYIVLKCLMGDILMAHLRRGSIEVVPGATVISGQPLAEIGNSGNTLEPHLHIEATKDDKAIGLSFNGRSLSINSLVTRK